MQDVVPSKLLLIIYTFRYKKTFLFPMKVSRKKVSMGRRGLVRQVILYLPAHWAF